MDARKLTVEGFGFKDVKSPYDRLPGRAEGVVPPNVWNLSRDSARAATTEIRAQWTVTNQNLAGANITAIASSGLDLYAKTDAGKWRWLGMGQPKFPETTAALITGIPSMACEFMVYLPLRNDVTSLEFAVPGRVDDAVSAVNGLLRLHLNRQSRGGPLDRSAAGRHALESPGVLREGPGDAADRGESLQSREYLGWLCVGSSEALVRFGLGPYEFASEIEIQRPGGVLQRLRSVRGDRVEGAKEP